MGLISCRNVADQSCRCSKFVTAQLRWMRVPSTSIACFIWLCAGIATTEYYFDVHAACAFQWSEFQRNQILASYFSRQLKYKLIRDFPGSEITEENIDAFLSEAVANGDFGLPYIGETLRYTSRYWHTMRASPRSAILVGFVVQFSFFAARGRMLSLCGGARTLMLSACIEQFAMSNG